MAGSLPSWGVTTAPPVLLSPLAPWRSPATPGSQVTCSRTPHLSGVSCGSPGLGLSPPLPETCPWSPSLSLGLKAPLLLGDLGPSAGLSLQLPTPKEPDPRPQTHAFRGGLCHLSGQASLCPPPTECTCVAARNPTGLTCSLGLSLSPPKPAHQGWPRLAAHGSVPWPPMEPSAWA